MPKTKKLPSLQQAVSLFDPRNRHLLQIRRIPTGFAGLDRALGGGLCPGLYVLGAIPNLGKSTLALQIAQNIASEGTPVCFFSMEMPKNRIAAKALSRQIFRNTRCPGYSSDRLLDPASASDPELWEQVRLARPLVAKACEQLYLFERQDQIRSAGDIVRTVEQVMEQLPEGASPVVMVDYLQILAGDRGSGFPSDRAVVDANIRALTELASVRQLPVLVISAFNRMNYQTPVSMEAFKESGAIEYSADVILGMQLRAVGSRDFDLNREKSRTPRELELIVLKQRYGRSGDALPLRYYPANDCFEEPDPDDGAFFPDLPERSLDSK